MVYLAVCQKLRYTEHSMNCPLCDTPTEYSISTKKRSFYACSSCGLLWADPSGYLDRESEKARYNLHENSRENEGYVRFIEAILETGLKHWQVLNNMDGYTDGGLDSRPLILDWGSGPEPLASELLRERGFRIHSYDPLFGPSLTSEDQLFDIIFCIEVAEHFKHPLDDFDAMARRLKVGGLLLVHTHTIPADVFTPTGEALRDFFIPWWYKEDPTHVAFYSEPSLQVLASCGGLQYEALDGEGTLHGFVKPLPVLVVGGANVDIEGRPFGPLKERDSNPGQVRFSRGGAGRNMAENLARLKIPVQFLSVFSADPLSRILMEETNKTGVGLEGALVVETNSPSCYLSILDEAGDMKLALSSMETMELLTPSALQSCLERILRSIRPGAPPFSAFIADGNLLPETIETLLDALPKIPAWFDPVSTAKARRLAAYKEGMLLGRFYGIKPNKDELFAMADALGLQVKTVESLMVQNFIQHARAQGPLSFNEKELARLLMVSYGLIGRGCGELHVSLGEAGVIRITKEWVVWGKPPLIPMRSATGAGDAYLAALVRTRVLNPVAAEASLVLSYGCAASAIALQDIEPVSQKMNPLALYRLRNRWEREQRFTVIEYPRSIYEQDNTAE